MIGIVNIGFKLPNYIQSLQEHEVHVIVQTSYVKVDQDEAVPCPNN